MSGFQRGGGGGGRGGGGGGGGGRDGGGRGGRDGGGGGGRDGGGRGGGGGGRDGGGRGGGFGGGRGGDMAPGLSGRNRHMGEVQSVATVVSPQTSGMSDADILKVISPPASERDRSVFINSSAPQGTEVSIVLPRPCVWRHSKKIGKVLDPKVNGIVRSNFFMLTPPEGSKRPANLYNYAIHIYGIDKTNRVEAESIAQSMEPVDSTGLMLSLRAAHPEWPADIGFAYDGKALAFTTKELPFTGSNAMGEPMLTEDVALKKTEGLDRLKSRFRVTMTLVQVIPYPSNMSSIDARVILPLENALLAFAKWQITKDSPEWFLNGNQAFRSTGETFPLSAAYVAMRGFKLSLHPIQSGLALVADMVVNCFLNGGEMTTIMMYAGGYRNLDEFVSECRRGLHAQVLTRIEQAVSSCKVLLKYLGKQLRKCKSLGPPAGSPKSKFCASDGSSITVAEHFTRMAADPAVGKIYKAAMGGPKLKYPDIPCINLGSEKKPIWVPPELVMIPRGQCRMKITDSEVVAKHIRYSAVRPDERMKYLLETSSGNNVLSALRADADAKAFGLSNISAAGLPVEATILPPPRLQYGKGQILEPRLAGTWNAEGRSVYLSASTFYKGGEIPYAVMLIGSRPPSNPDYQNVVANFFATMEKDGLLLGIKIKQKNTVITCRPHPKEMEEKFKLCTSAGVGFVFCVMVDPDIYGAVKLQSDQLGMITQCLKWKNVERPPKSFPFNVMLKVNTKVGGTNHVLVARGPAVAGGGFQSPPQSLSWVFEKPCMLVGIDVSHPEFGSKAESAAAVVASMDGMCCQYAAYLSTQSANEEMVSTLEESMIHLLKLFKERNNGKLPVHVILYRDGVSEGQFNLVNATEIPAMKAAFAALGTDPDTVKISAVVCQKRHNTKLAFEETTAGGTEYVNICPGLLVDGTSKNSICNPDYNEFYLNAHVAIQGTAKASKYTLIYDEIGFKMAELELMTYWLSYLYCRCNKAVSYASPAYYAHWASRRGRYLFAAGARNVELEGISKVFGDAKRKAMMFFV